MTIDTLIGKISQIDIRLLLALFSAPPFLAWGLGHLHRPGHGEYRPWTYLYASLVYLVCIPGMFSAILTAYSLFFIRQNLLQVSLVVYFLPIACMIVTLVLIRKRVFAWDRLPGVDRLCALMLILGISFGIALFIQKTRVWIFFGGSVGTLILIALFCFALLKWATHTLFRAGDEPEIPFSARDRRRSGPKVKPKNPAEEMAKLKKKLGIRDD
ncbi:hypothetical protein DENIS_3166 [Desulfonema ishimotonii]|uniref:Uncharacterized protein n=1 Tax=Desulfonema ishimotonii TaxID=45657 RepID=A0A401FZ19_9BACT|nr:hypothetical protein [Desulfonema ishimotonii]GBC62197.1 hypothetical protein DENIS_3166 [Desulfonema ishimotonii]